MAGLGRKVFTAGDVLTASDVQNYLMDQTVMNFAGTAARSSAIATPTQGMVSYRDDLDNLELYNGSAWVSASGLQLVKKQTVGTAVSSITVTSCFNATYNNYKIMYSGGVGSANSEFQFQLTGITTSVYHAQLTYGAFGSNSAPQNVSSSAATYSPWLGGFNANGAQFDMEIQNPFLTVRKLGSGVFIQPGSVNNNGTSRHFIDSTTSSTGFTLTTNTGTVTGGTIYVYGYGT